MRGLWVVVVGAIVLTVVAPIHSQPYVDVPTTTGPGSWAYDAIAKLVEKELVEGYPDGTFKGDRAMTRYEMAMVVARLLARIESIQIPPSQAPQVTRADLEAIRRLLTEFRTELAALGVRVAALEEELNAIGAKLDNIRIAGALTLRYDGTAAGPPSSCPTGSPPNTVTQSVNGNPNTCSTPVDTRYYPPFRAREGMKLLFDGSVAPGDVHVFVGLAMVSNTTGTPTTFNSSNIGTPAGTASSPLYVLANIYNLFIDWKNAGGAPLEVWIGRFGNAGSGFGKHDMQFGPFGLLLNTGSSTWAASTGNSGVNLVDGLAVFGEWASLADLKVKGLITRVVGSTGSAGYANGEDAYGIDANVQLRQGLRLGGYYVGNSINPLTPTQVGAPSALWHVYGNPASPSTSPPTTNCRAVTTNLVANGITCAAAGSGAGGYVMGDVRGIHFGGEFASWSDSVNSITDSGWQVNVNWDLKTLMGIEQRLSLQTGYLYFGANFYPPYGAADADAGPTGFPMYDVIFPGNAQGFTAQLSWDPVQNWTVYGVFFGGNNISNGQSLTEWECGVKYVVKYDSTSGITAKVLVRDLRINNIDQSLLYRAQVEYTF